MSEVAVSDVAVSDVAVSSVSALDVTALDVTALDVTALDVTALDVTALDVLGPALVVAGLLALALPLLGIAVRRRLLQRGGGTVEMSLRTRADRPSRGWALGIGRFEGEELTWWRMFSLARRPRHRMCRSDLEVLGRREPGRGEAYALPPGAVVLQCTSSRGPIELATVPSAVTGLLAWLEAGPPGASLPGRGVALSARRRGPTSRRRRGSRPGTG